MQLQEIFVRLFLQFIGITAPILTIGYYKESYTNGFLGDAGI